MRARQLLGLAAASVALAALAPVGSAVASTHQAAPVSVTAEACVSGGGKVVKQVGATICVGGKFNGQVVVG
ncbi:hypothetical protein HYE82_29835 [Streptomyces sp. BR123]|uniref:hypothetical protein n=1 Tax=Streptomyces sp. BR123 TaxID=2749828 RepID=UPI0015C4CB0B|nr:hypothetical protein [Streptomyces sp. BR123]NXY98504.1 hypothetical protein [Streptomyces sp. BR123]